MSLATWMRRCGASLVIVLSGLVTAPHAWSQTPTRINLGTLAPRGSSFHQALQLMGERWRQAPEGGARLVVYPDGAQGGEADMVRLMRVGALQSGLLTAVGLSQIEPGVSGLQSIPLLFRSYDEFDYVMTHMRPTLEQRLNQKGFVVLFWADAGWVRYFFTEPVITPADFRRAKVFAWAGNPQQYELMRGAGLNPVALETADIIQALGTRQITAVSVPPIFALVSQFEKRAPHMIDLKWAPLMGACVVRADVWQHIPAAARESMLVAANEAAQQIRATNRKEADSAIQRMQAAGLTVHALTPEQQTDWQRSVEELYPRIRGGIVPADVFDEVTRLVGEYRATRG